MGKRPVVVGEFDEAGHSLLPNLSELTPAMIARAIAKRLAPIYSSASIDERLAFLAAKEASLAAPKHTTVRTPHFCSGCPHNTSTKLPEGSRAQGGIGCHYMTQWMDRNTDTFTQMGGEGATWIGQAPFTDTPHIFQNLGDGTYFHSGQLALRAAVAAGVFTTTEEPPADLEAFRKQNAESSGLFNGLSEIAENFKSMPAVMWKLGVVQFFSWFAFFTMWSFATPALTEHVYHAAMPQHGDAHFDAKNEAFNQAANVIGSSMGMYGLSSMAFALILTLVTARNGINRRRIHMISLLAGGAGFLLMTTANEANDGILNLAFALIGITWGSILSMPYAILSSSVKPEKMGVSMGIFNMFIVIPQIVAALGGINWAYKTFLGDEIINTMVLAGIALILGALSTLMLPKQKG